MNHQPWHDRARELLAIGLRVQQVADEVGKSDDMVRVALNINGAGERLKERLARLKVRKTQAREAIPAAARVRVATITLPTFSMPSLPVEMDAKPQIRLAPVPRVVVNEGAERIRAIHQRMLRTGMIVERGLVEEFGL